jgi:hypothetical protein
VLNQNESLSWVRGYTRRSRGLVPNTYTATYHLTQLMADGYIDPVDGQAMLDESGLREFCWQVTWPEDYETPDEDMVNRVHNVQGYVVFVHGWTGNHTIWEELPGMVALANRRMVSLAVDHNGFGDTRFSNVMPELETCNPPAAMRTLERWVTLIKLRRQPGDPNRKVLNFVGHSMGGAMLFYLNPIFWNDGEVTRCAVAPALLLEDEQYRRFYTTLGIGIGILQRVGPLKVVERFIRPAMVETICAGASNRVKEIHSRQYNETARGVTGATFMAMGTLSNWEIARNWEFFRVTLAHRDRLVGLTGMIDLLSKMEFPVANVRVVPGSHYPFSIGSEDPQNAFLHAQNRDLVVQDVLTLHEAALRVQKEGRRVG